MAEYSRLASGKVSSNGGSTAVRLPFIPDFIEISNKKSAQTGLGVYRAWWNTDMGVGSAFLESANSATSGSYGYVYALIPQTVQAWTVGGYVQGGFGTVQFDGIGPSVGVSAPLASGNIVVANAGTYEVTFQASGTGPNQFAIFVNGVAQQSTVGGSGAGTQQNSISSILTLPAGAVINLVNYVTAGATGLASVVGGTQPNVTANVTITQLAASAGLGVVGYIDVIGGTSSSGLVNGTGFTTIQAGLALQYGPVYGHTATTDFSITATNPMVVTTTTAHNLVSGNVIVFTGLAQTATTGMSQIANIPFVVTVLSPTTFSINYNGSTSNFNAFNSLTSLSFNGSFRQVLYPALYVPGEAFVNAITLGATTTVVTTAPNNFVVGQEVAFRIPSQWGTVELNSLPNVLIPGSPIYGYVQSVTNSTTFVVNINSTAFTPFVSNQSFLGTRTFAQVVATGDINRGGWPYTGTDINPSPLVNDGTGVNQVRTINGPAIQGAYINNTWQGFIIGPGVAGLATDTLYWRAYMSDINYK